MNVLLKKFFIILYLLLLPSFAYAAENVELLIGKDYLLTTEQNVKSYTCASPSVLTIQPFYTIFNEKNVILLHPQKIGKTALIVNTDKTSATFNVKVSSSKDSKGIESLTVGSFEIMLLDSPPKTEEIKIDPPPQNKEAK